MPHFIIIIIMMQEERLPDLLFSMLVDWLGQIRRTPRIALTAFPA